jgi:hypothetical protein
VCTIPCELDDCFEARFPMDVARWVAPPSQHILAALGCNTNNCHPKFVLLVLSLMDCLAIIQCYMVWCQKRAPARSLFSLRVLPSRMDAAGVTVPDIVRKHLVYG